MEKVTALQRGRGIALYGGAFDPVHCAHLAIAERALASELVDQLVFIPAAQSPLKVHGPLVSNEQRLDMLKLATEGYPQFAVDDFELRKGGTSYSVETVRHFKELHPEAQLFWILGADQFEQLGRWRAIEELAKMVEFLVFARPGSSLELPAIGGKLRYQILEAPLMPQSSSEIRRRLGAGEALEAWVPGAVEAFISQHGLYK